MSNHILQLYACLFHLKQRLQEYSEVINNKMPLYVIRFEYET